jgi:hypothetical protein
MTESLATSHPIGLIVEDDLKRNRLTVFFRLLLAIPQLIWISMSIRSSRSSAGSTAWRPGI